jgi:peroxiredoxin family protein
MATDLDVAEATLATPSKALDEWFDTRFAQKMAEYNEQKIPTVSILVSKGSLDWAYPPFIVASTAAAMGWKVSVFFTFYGLGLLKKELDLEISGLGNPAMPMKMPFGPKWFQDIQWNIPNLIQANVPGFEKLATGLMNETLRKKGVAPIADLREACVETDVDLVACQMTADLFGWEKDEFFPGITEWAGAATYLSKARDADITLFI